MASVKANLYVSEDTLGAGTTTLSFPWRARSIELINDSGELDITYKFNVSESAATLKPGEVMNTTLHSDSLILTGQGAPYRVRAEG